MRDQGKRKAVKRGKDDKQIEPAKIKAKKVKYADEMTKSKKEKVQKMKIHINNLQPHLLVCLLIFF